MVLDKATGELVERATFQAYGGAESDYRPGRWANFREDYRFTGKEEDVEVGLQYFGKRYLNPLLGRWVSADPLAIHAPGQADLNVYAYVSGAVLKNVDPLGLSEEAANQLDGQVEQASQELSDVQDELGVVSENLQQANSYLADQVDEAEREKVGDYINEQESKLADLKERETELGSFIANASSLADHMRTSARANEGFERSLQASEREYAFHSATGALDADLETIEAARQVTLGMAGAATATILVVATGGAALAGTGLAAETAAAWASGMGTSAFGAMVTSSVDQVATTGEVDARELAKTGGLATLTGFGLGGPLAAVGLKGATGVAVSLAEGALSNMVGSDDPIPDAAVGAGTNLLTEVGEALVK